jgi:hypothetical protein
MQVDNPNFLSNILGEVEASAGSMNWIAGRMRDRCWGPAEDDIWAATGSGDVCRRAARRGVVGARRGVSWAAM